jgi:hypothetical protein
MTETDVLKTAKECVLLRFGVSPPISFFARVNGHDAKQWNFCTEICPQLESVQPLQGGWMVSFQCSLGIAHPQGPIDRVIVFVDEVSKAATIVE